MSAGTGHRERRGADVVSAGATAAAVTPTAGAGRGGGAGTPPVAGPSASLRRVLAAERRKLLAQLSTRVLALVCVLGPLGFGAVLRLQSGVPADTLFGVWVHTSGFAVSLVVLGFAGTWGLPVVAGILAGDVFSGEDRHGTWKTVLTRSASRRTLFAGKLLAVVEIMLALTVCLAASSLVAGLLSTGAQPLVGLSGLAIGPGRLLGLVAAAWATTLPVTLGFTCLAMLCSLVTRNGIAGPIGPILVALVVTLLDLIGGGSTVHALLLGTAYSDWHGLFVAHPFLQPLLVGSLVSLAWGLAALALAWRILRRRDFAGPSAGARRGWRRPPAFAIAGLLIVGLLAAGTSLGPTTITTGRLARSLTPSFQRLAVAQQRQLGRPVPARARLRVLPICQRRGSGSGPGDDWTCTLEVFIPQQGVQPFRQTPVTYDMSVQSNGCYKADAPPAFIGQQLMRAPHGREIVNPLYTIYGCFETDG